EKSGCYYPKKSKSEIFNSGVKEVFEIELENGKKILVTEDHKLFKVKRGKIVEEVVGNLKEGDQLKVYPKDYVKNFYDNARKRSKQKQEKQYSNKCLCKKCVRLMFKESKYSKNICKTCLEKINIKPKKDWFEWEDNLLRQYYYGWEKEKLLDILPLRNSWKGIQHRANRLNIKRNPKFKQEVNAWTSKNNPIHDPILKEKMIRGHVKYIYKKNVMTSIEKKIADFLDIHNVKYDFNKVVRTKTTFRFPDFQIGKIIIEADGIYFHKMRKDDLGRQKELEEMGFEFLRFTDIQINKDWEDVKKCITQKLNL
ncbi:hypothetical protein LCGC14_1387960, partial [marine sediment metagenome]